MRFFPAAASSQFIPSASLPRFNVREAVFMVFNADIPPNLQPPLLFPFCPFVPPLQALCQ